MTRWTKEQYEAYMNKGQKKSKYNAVKTEIDGVVFDSRKEGERYIELKNLERANLIYDLELQPRFELQESYDIGGRHVRKIEYVADFSYYDAQTRNRIVEDVKGLKTDVYKLKKKLFEYKYGVEITEI